MAIQFRQRPYDSIKDHDGLNPLLERIYSARGIQSKNELDYTLSQLLNPSELYQIESAAKFISEHIQQQSSFLIIGDYDADGATSTALMIKALNLLGAKQIDYVLPDRVSEGYGLSVGLVHRVLKQKPAVVITVDTGISSVEGVKTLKAAGVNVVITDHHLPADELPRADFIVNPNAYDKSISPKGRYLAGVGVAFYLMLSVRAQLRKENYFNNSTAEPNLAMLLDLVALGTVADLVPLDHLNRILVAQGLKLIQQKQCCDGISQLFSVSNKDQTQADQQDLAFSIAPKINAAGRIDDMSLGVQCLCSTGLQSTQFAQQLNDINNQRRSLQNDIQLDTDEMLDQFNKHDIPKGIVLSNKEWHEGIVGIVASKIKAKLNRPVFVFAQADDGSLKGSGRSIVGIHLRDVLDLIDKRHTGLILKFGGHAMAAGLSLSSNGIDKFEKAFNDILYELYDEELFLQSILTDGELSSSELTLQTAELIKRAGPWGQCFEEPVFFGRFNIIQKRILKEQHLKLVLGLDNCQQTFDAIAFFCDDEQLYFDSEKIDIFYTLSINEFRNQRSLQLLINRFSIIV